MQWNNTLLDQNSSLHTNYVGRSVRKKTVVRNRVNYCTICISDSFFAAFLHWIDF